MTVIDRIEQSLTLWRMILPHIPEPSPEDAARWCAYPLASVESAILRTGKRFGRTKINIESFDPLSAHKYVTATARKITMHANDGVQNNGPTRTHPNDSK